MSKYCVIIEIDSNGSGSAPAPGQPAHGLSSLPPGTAAQVALTAAWSFGRFGLGGGINELWLTRGLLTLVNAAGTC